MSRSYTHIPIVGMRDGMADTCSVTAPGITPCGGAGMRFSGAAAPFERDHQD